MKKAHFLSNPVDYRIYDRKQRSGQRGQVMQNTKQIADNTVSSPGWARTTDTRINSPAYTSNRSDDNAFDGNDLRRCVKSSPNFVCTTVCTNSGSVAGNSLQLSTSIDKIIAAWPHIPPHIRDTILTLIDSVQFRPSDNCGNAKPSVQTTAKVRANFEYRSHELVSRTMLKALRHTPELYALRMDTDGWVSCVEFGILVSQLSGSDSIPNCDEMQNTICKLGIGDRVQFKDGFIRAHYGHSTERFSPRVSTPPDVPLFHGTSADNWSIIESFGLSSNGRRFVQLTTDFDYASKIASSSGRSPIVLQVTTARAISNGVSFYPTDSHVWLSTAIPPNCLQVWLDDACDLDEPLF